MEAFPEAKVVLSERSDGGEGWHRSMNGSVMRMRESRRGFAVRTMMALQGKGELMKLLHELGQYVPEWMDTGEVLSHHTSSLSISLSEQASRPPCRAASRAPRPTTTAGSVRSPAPCPPPAC